jgi:hypothetical protein
MSKPYFIFHYYENNNYENKIYFIARTAAEKYESQIYKRGINLITTKNI